LLGCKKTQVKISELETLLAAATDAANRARQEVANAVAREQDLLAQTAKYACSNCQECVLLLLLFLFFAPLLSSGIEKNKNRVG